MTCSMNQALKIITVLLEVKIKFSSYTLRKIQQPYSAHIVTANQKVKVDLTQNTLRGK